MYDLNDIYTSLQGEGRWQGRPAVFLRFTSCNLACPWCDTKRIAKFKLEAHEILEKIDKYNVKNVVLTGGEPTVQPHLGHLLKVLKASGYILTIETNGMIAVPETELCDYVVLSPKYLYRNRYLDATMLRKADEVRIVAEDEHMVEFCENMRGRITADAYYITPLELAKKIHYRRAYDLLMRLNKKSKDASNPWMLAIRMHKVLGIK